MENERIIIHRNFHSKTLNNRRDIFVYLPPGYDDGREEGYPILYVNDGQNIFETGTSFAGMSWGLEDTLNRLIEEGAIKPLIVTAISNTPDRTDEYTYTPDPEEGGGNAMAYALFLVDELKPFIDEEYNTSRSPLDTGIMGSSYGGLNALFMGWTFPDVFSIVAGLSPSLWWAEGDFIRFIAEEDRISKPSKIWLDMGTEEEDEEDYDFDEYLEYWEEDPDDETEDEFFGPLLTEAEENIENARLLRNVLMDRGYELDYDLFYYEDAGATHDEWYWGNRMDLVLTALFPAHENDDEEDDDDGEEG